jgi:hypothetical protein
VVSAALKPGVRSPKAGRFLALARLRGAWHPKNNPTTVLPELTVFQKTPIGKRAGDAIASTAAARFASLR